MNQLIDDRALNQLTHYKDRWLQVTIPERIEYLRQCIAGVKAVAADWAIAACHAKGIDPESPLAGEEWLVGPVATLANVRSLIQSLQAQGKPTPPTIRTRPNGQIVATVVPDNWSDRLLWWGFRGEVWLQPGAAATQGLVYRQKPDRGRIALVLGAGNISAIAAMDTLYKLFAEDQVVLLKLNPVNDYVGKYLHDAFHCLIESGFLHIVYGGAAAGAAYCQHPAVDTIHVTGSHHTHDAIVWGSTATEQQFRKAENRPLNPKPITSELGCVTPILVVPGNWSIAQLKYHARQVASMVAHNASFNCVAGKVLVVAKGWQLREPFLQHVRQELARIPPRKAYYPGAYPRYQEFLAHYPQAQVVGKTLEEEEFPVPWTVIPDVPPIAGEYALTTEAFCGVLAEVTLDSADAATFLTDAVQFANETIWGNLSCVLLIDPHTQNQLADSWDQAIAALRYGAIGINAWTATIFSLASLPWGAYPGNPLTDICSGRGIVHNTYLFEHLQKAVLYAPFQLPITPLWFANHQTLQLVARRYLDFLMNPGWGKLLSLIAAAARG